LKNEEDHVEFLVVAFRLLREHKVYSKIIKLSFFETYVYYLGHVILKEHIVVDLEKIRATIVWEAPRNAD